MKSVYFQILDNGSFDYEDYVSSASNLYYLISEDTAEDQLIYIKTGLTVTEGEVSEGSVTEEIDNTIRETIEFVWPCEGTTITADMTSYSNHTGIDIGLGQELDVYAAAEGVVEEAVRGKTGYGYYILIDHGNGVKTLYAHCHELYVEVGQRVEAGELIALTGSTGNSTGCHLHFEVRINGEYADPKDYL